MTHWTKTFRFLPALLLCLWANAPGPLAAADRPLSVGVLKFGTVSWQLDTLKSHGLDAAEGLSLETLALASNNATAVALQAGEVDLIVSDWIWVMRQRAAGDDLVFVPYSHALGALIAGTGKGIARIEDLAGKQIGVAGGPVDKSWLVLRAWSEAKLGLDIGERATPVFGAPPLLSEQLRRGELDAVLTFWPFAARLEAEGHRQIVGTSDLLADLGIDGPLPLIGYVFRESLAQERLAEVEGFFRAVAAANDILLSSDQEWARLRPLMRAESDAEFERLKAGFQAGLPKDFTVDPAQAEALYAILAKWGGEKLLGRDTRYDANAFRTFGAR